MFQLSGFYCNIPIFEGTRRVLEGFGLFASRIRRLLGLLWQPKIPFSAFGFRTLGLGVSGFGVEGLGVAQGLGSANCKDAPSRENRKLFLNV